MFLSVQRAVEIIKDEIIVLCISTKVFKFFYLIYFSYFGISSYIKIQLHVTTDPKISGYNRRASDIDLYMLTKLKMSINGKKKSDLKRGKGLQIFLREMGLIPKVNYHSV